MNLLSLAVIALASDPVAVSEAVELKTPTGTLYGTLDLPPRPGPWPVVLLHPGSGPTDRDGNQRAMKNDSLKLLGEALAARGVACLRVDKRGVGASAKALEKEEDVRFEHYAADAAALVTLLRGDRRFTRVGFVGHSEGAVVGALAGWSVKLDAFVSLCGPGRRLSDVIRDQVKGRLPADLADKNEAILKALEAGTTVADVPTSLAALYRPSVQPYIISLFKHDPAELVGRLDCPVLVVTGTTDLQVPRADGERLAAAKTGTRHVSVKEMSHVLKQTAEMRLPVQAATVYVDPTRPLHPALAGLLAGFLTKAPAADR